CDRRILGRAISGQRRSAFNWLLYENARFQFGHAEPARVRPGVNRRPQVDLERAWGIRVATDAGWPQPGARRMEPRAPSGERFAWANRSPERSGPAFSK